jgi:hypothetical protein
MGRSCGRRSCAQSSPRPFSFLAAFFIALPDTALPRGVGPEQAVRRRADRVPAKMRALIGVAITAQVLSRLSLQV